MFPGRVAIRLNHFSHRVRVRLKRGGVPGWLLAFASVSLEPFVYLRTLVVSVLYPMHFYRRVSMMLSETYEEFPVAYIAAPTKYFAGWFAVVSPLIAINAQLQLIPFPVRLEFEPATYVVFLLGSFAAALAAPLFAVLCSAILIACVQIWKVLASAAHWALRSHWVSLDFSLVRAVTSGEFWHAYRWGDFFGCMFYYALNVPFMILAVAPGVALVRVSVYLWTDFVTKVFRAHTYSYFLVVLVSALSFLVMSGLAYAYLVRPFICALVYCSRLHPINNVNFPGLVYFSWAPRKRYHLPCLQFSRVDFVWEDGPKNLRGWRDSRPVTFAFGENKRFVLSAEDLKTYPYWTYKFPDGSIVRFKLEAFWREYFLSWTVKYGHCA